MTLFPGHMCPLASDSKVWGCPVLFPPAMLPARSGHFCIVVYLAFPSWLQPQHHMALGCMSTLHLLWCFLFSPEHPWCMGTELLRIGLGGMCTVLLSAPQSQQEHWDRISGTSLNASFLPWPGQQQAFYFSLSLSFFLNLILFFNFTMLYWFCHISTWIRHRYTRVPHLEPSSLLPPCTIPLGHPSAPAPSIQYRASNLLLPDCSLHIGRILWTGSSFT